MMIAFVRYLEEMRAHHHCDHLMLLTLATVLRRQIILYSGAEQIPEPIHIIPDHVEDRFRPIHVGHSSGLTFVTLRPTTNVQERDDDEIVPDDDDFMIEDYEMEEDDMSDTDGLGEYQFHRSTAGETSHWNVCILLFSSVYFVMPPTNWEH